ncbi:unnamed protein product, partial [Gulo gulo]
MRYRPWEWHNALGNAGCHGHFGVKKTLAGVQGQDFGSAATIIFQKCDDRTSRNSFLSRLQECLLYMFERDLRNEAFGDF